MLFDVWHRVVGQACAYVSELSLVEIVLPSPWSTDTVSVEEGADGSGDGNNMGTMGAGWPSIRWAMCVNDDVRRGFVCMSAVLSLP